MGYFGGVLDLVASRIVEAVLALPSVMVAFLFIVALGPSEVTLVIVIGFIFTPLIARTVRAAVLAERHLDYLPAARLLGAGAWSVMFVEILPNVLPAVLVEFSVRLGYAIFTVATLSFLGFGIQPPTPDWGSDIAANYGVLAAGYWWETLFPALAIASLVVAVNLITDSMEQVPACMSETRAASALAALPPARPAAVERIARLEDRRLVDHVPDARADRRPAVQDVSLRIAPGESYGLVGESGSGKSTVALAVTRYLPRNGRVAAGSIAVAGQDVLGMRSAALRELRRRSVSMVYQEPTRALNPACGSARRSPRCSRWPGWTPGPATKRPPRCCARCASPTRPRSCGATRTNCPAGWRSGW